MGDPLARIIGVYTMGDMTNDATKTRAIEYVDACRAEFTRKVNARDAIENCISEDWRRAHAAARSAAVSLDGAKRHAYQVGALVKPYWE